VRAAVLERFGEPLVVRDVPDPVAGADDVIVRVRAAGLCGTDLKITSGALPYVHPPVIPGHEVAGELVDDHGELRRGQRVACYLYESCGDCRLCRLGEPTLCRALVRIGVHRDGGLAEYLRIPACNALPIEDHVPFELAATSMDAVLTPWRGLRSRAKLREGETLLVVGAGGLGLSAVQVGVALGARVAVVDPSAENRDRATELGAELALAPDAVAEALEWSGGGADVAFDSSGAPEGFRTALDGLRPAGRLVAVGYVVGVDYAFESSRLPLDEVTIVGVRPGTREEAIEVLDAVARGVVLPAVMDSLPLEQVNVALDQLRVGRAIGRMVIDPAVH
jgi:D-arabinose 1-dehydrogenase-like Zn-dependent alcohol dehydrogenase